MAGSPITSTSLMPRQDPIAQALFGESFASHVRMFLAHVRNCAPRRLMTAPIRTQRRYFRYAPHQQLSQPLASALPWAFSSGSSHTVPAFRGMVASGAQHRAASSHASSACVDSGTELSLTTSCPTETLALGARLAAGCTPGDVICLHGYAMAPRVKNHAL